MGATRVALWLRAALRRASVWGIGVSPTAAHDGSRGSEGRGTLIKLCCDWLKLESRVDGLSWAGWASLQIRDVPITGLLYGISRRKKGIRKRSE
jgi:hypothetical protein